jgi:sulfur-oxidizing protein SoxX
MSADEGREEINAPDAMRLRMRPAAVTQFILMVTAICAGISHIGFADAQALAPYTVSGDGISEPLSGLRGDAARGKSTVANRQQGLCVLCHQLPPELNVPAAFQGNIAPTLAGAGARLSEAQLRLRLVDSRRVSPYSVMPSYYRTENLTRVGRTFQSTPILDAQQIEDVVAYLMTLK